MASSPHSPSCQETTPPVSDDPPRANVLQGEDSAPAIKEPFAPPFSTCAFCSSVHDGTGPQWAMRSACCHVMCGTCERFVAMSRWGGFTRIAVKCAQLGCTTGVHIMHEGDIQNAQLNSFPLRPTQCEIAVVMSSPFLVTVKTVFYPGSAAHRRLPIEGHQKKVPAQKDGSASPVVMCGTTNLPLVTLAEDLEESKNWATEQCPVCREEHHYKSFFRNSTCHHPICGRCINGIYSHVASDDMPEICIPCPGANCRDVFCLDPAVFLTQLGHYRSNRLPTCQSFVNMKIGQPVRDERKSVEVAAPASGVPAIVEPSGDINLSARVPHQRSETPGGLFTTPGGPLLSETPASTMPATVSAASNASPPLPEPYQKCSACSRSMLIQGQFLHDMGQACGHVFCKACLKPMIKKFEKANFFWSDREPGKLMSKASSFPCPACLAEPEPRLVIAGRLAWKPENRQKFGSRHLTRLYEAQEETLAEQLRQKWSSICVPTMLVYAAYATLFAFVTVALTGAKEMDAKGVAGLVWWMFGVTCYSTISTTITVACAMIMLGDGFATFSRIAADAWDTFVHAAPPLRTFFEASERLDSFRAAMKAKGLQTMK